MSLLNKIVGRVRALRRRSRAERDLEDELRAYVDALAERHESRGLPPDEARRAAMVEMGGLEQVKEDVRDVRIGSRLESTLRDARHGARVLWRAPGYAVVVILTIALGIGLNVAVFSVIHGVLWRSLPYPDADRLVAIEADTRALPSAYNSPREVFDPREQLSLVASLAYVEGRDATIELDGLMERVPAARATDDVLPLLGAVPLQHGRPLAVAQDARGVYMNGVVISYELWQRRFHADPRIVGRRFTVNNQDVQVVGVTRPDFRLYVPAENYAEDRIDIWMPATYSAGLLYRGRTMIGRLAPGATIADAQGEADRLAASFVARAPDAYPNGALRLSIRPLADVITRDARPTLLALAAAVGFVLLIACVNVANLTLVRAKGREHELAVRRALGATRPRLVRQLLAENLAVTAIGGALGLLFARAGIGILDWLRPVHLPRQSDITIDGVVLLWTAGLTIAASVASGLAPALLLAGRGAGPPLHAGRAGSLMLRHGRLHRGLVVAEVSLSIIPLIAAGLMLRTFTNLLYAPIGFNPAQVITARIPLNLTAFNTVDRRSTFYRDAIATVDALPGVEAASIGGPLPFARAQVTQRYWRRDDPDAAPSIGMLQSIMPGYFRVLEIPLRAGRDLTDDDIAGQRRVAVVDERLAAQLWPASPIGQRLAIGEKQTLEVVGVVAPIRARQVRDDSTPTIYVPSHVYEIEQTLVVRTRMPAASFAPALKQAVEALGPGRSVFDIGPLDAVVAASIADTRFAMLVLSGFAMTALLLAGVGLYATLAYLLSQRTQEFGVRVALGASAAGLVRLVLREAGILTGLGAALGLAVALLAARGLRGSLYGVTPVDTVTIAAAMALVATAAIVAIIRPARRASRIDPVVALREGGGGSGGRE